MRSHKLPKVSDSDPDANSDTDSDNKGADAPPLPLLLNTDGFKAKWAEYEAYRRQSGMRKLKPASIAKQWDEMAAWGHDAAIAAIDQTIRKGWQGIFEPKPEGSRGGPAKPSEFAGRF